MSKVFGEYSKYYDEFYRTKDYVAECDYVETLIREFGVRKRGVLLDLGCGTGGHSLILAKRGWKVHAVDRSSTMLAIAKKKAETKKLRVSFYESDIQEFEIPQKADAAIAMFAVVSYLTKNEELTRFFKNVAEQVKFGAVFIFDVWFGPAVLHEKPSDRLKVIKVGEKRVMRFAKPVHDLHNQSVEVRYHTLTHVESTLVEENEESHRMRYFFPAEIKLLLNGAGFELLRTLPFLDTDRVPSESDWNITVVARRNVS